VHRRLALLSLWSTAISIIIDGRFQVFQRFSSSKLVLKTVESCFVALNCYGDGSNGKPTAAQEINELIEQENYDPVDTKLRAHLEHWQYVKKFKEADGLDIDRDVHMYIFQTVSSSKRILKTVKDRFWP
jgi:hypothetical protein